MWVKVKKFVPFMILSAVIFGSSGYFLFVGGMLHSHTLCPISILWGNNCPPTMNSLSFIEHHVAGWQSLFLVTVNFGLNIFLWLSLLFLFAAFCILGVQANLFKQVGYFFLFKENNKHKFLSTRKSLAWLVAIRSVCPVGILRAHT